MDYDEESLRLLIKEAINEAIQETVIPVFCKMLQDSDGRIDRTNQMIEKLSAVIDRLEECRNKQLLISESSRDLAQENLRGVIHSNDLLLATIDKIQADDQKTMSRYQNELQSAKEMVKELRAEYRELAMNQAKCTAEVNISK